VIGYEIRRDDIEVVDGLHGARDLPRNRDGDSSATRDVPRAKFSPPAHIDHLVLAARQQHR